MSTKFGKGGPPPCIGPRDDGPHAQGGDHPIKRGVPESVSGLAWGFLKHEHWRPLTPPRLQYTPPSP